MGIAKKIAKLVIRALKTLKYTKNKCSININKYYYISTCSCKTDKNLESTIRDSAVTCDTIMNAVVKSYDNLTFYGKKIYFYCIRCYTCVQVFLHKLHLHETPSHVFINRLKAERFSVFLICGGSLFHIFNPRTLKLFSPNFTWLALITFKFRFNNLPQI